MYPEYTDKILATVNTRGDADTPQAILHGVYSAVIAGDFEKFRDAVSEDVELHISGFGPMDGAWRGRDEVVEATRKNFASVTQQRPEIEGMVSQGDAIAVLLRESGVHKSTGEAYRIRCVQWFTFAAGKIKRVDQIVAGV